MFHPVGPQPPSVYWRRRLLLVVSIVALVVLLIVTVNAVRSNGPDSAGAAGPSPAPTNTARLSTRPTASSTVGTAIASASKVSTSATSRGSSSTVAKPPPACVVNSLKLQSVVGKSSYAVGDQPLLQLEVTNVASTPCVQDLADKQVELRVYNGESRVWGSHDCPVQSTTAVRTLAPRMPVLIAITWSGLTSQPGCKGTRQRVGAGTYTLYSSLAGRTGRAAQFTIE